MAKIRDGKSIGKTTKKVSKAKIVEEPIIEGKALVQSSQARIYESRIDKVDKELQLNTNLAEQPRLSTGLLTCDLVLGRGFVPGFSVFFGAEASAKSTAAMTALGSSLRQDIAMRKYFDAEGAIDRTYTSRVLRTDGFSTVFGERSDNGTWTIPPMCRYHDSNIIEKVFRSIHRSISFMPDKVYRPQEGMWYYVFERDKESVALAKELEKHYDAQCSKKLFTATGKYWLPIGEDNNSPQGIVLIDSIPSLIPERIDEEEISDRAMAIEARTLGPMIKLVRGKLRPKGVILLAVNQLRANPGAGPGQLPFYETGGNVLKFASDSRTMWTSRVPLDNFPRLQENKGLCGEPSVEYEGATDFYAFKGITNHKNKYGQPFRKGASRVWIKDGVGAARGFCPAYDTISFLKALDLIEGPLHDGRKKFRIKLKKLKGAEFSWSDFKTVILAQEYNNSKLRAKAKDLSLPVKVDIRDICFNMLKSGRSEVLIAAAAARKPKGDSIDLEATDDD